MDIQDDEPVIEATWQVAQLNKNTLQMIQALKEQEHFDEALRRAQEADEAGGK